MAKKSRLGKDVFSDLSPDDFQIEDMPAKTVEIVPPEKKEEPKINSTVLSVIFYEPELKHLEKIRQKLKEEGIGDFTREELIRFSINLLSHEDFAKK